MKIGIDFDNTIACYDGVFHTAAVERGLVPKEIKTDKTSVRNYLRSVGQEDDWTELQGYVYGARMDLVESYQGFSEFLSRALTDGHTIFVISHKTKEPFLGPKYDLHAAAREFLKSKSLMTGQAIPEENAFFELTLQEKIQRIKTQKCDLFIDDLPELLGEEMFPSDVRGILFDPASHYPEGIYKGKKFESYANWTAIGEAVLSQ